MVEHSSKILASEEEASTNWKYMIVRISSYLMIDL